MGKRRPSSKKTPHWLSGLLSPEVGCDVGPKDLTDEKTGLGAGWDGVKKASSRNISRWMARKA